jgi:hypothetical protein
MYFLIFSFFFFLNHILLLYQVLEPKVSKSIILKPFLWTQIIVLQLHKLDDIQCDNLKHLAYLNGVLNTYTKAQTMDINKIYEQLIYKKTPILFVNSNMKINIHNDNP